MTHGLALGMVVAVYVASNLPLTLHSDPHDTVARSLIGKTERYLVPCTCEDPPATTCGSECRWSFRGILDGRDQLFGSKATKTEALEALAAFTTQEESMALFFQRPSSWSPLGVVCMGCKIPRVDRKFTEQEERVRSGVKKAIADAIAKAGRIAVKLEVLPTLFPSQQEMASSLKLEPPLGGFLSGYAKDVFDAMHAVARLQEEIALAEKSMDFTGTAIGSLLANLSLSLDRADTSFKTMPGSLRSFLGSLDHFVPETSQFNTDVLIPGPDNWYLIRWDVMALGTVETVEVFPDLTVSLALTQVANNSSSPFPFGRTISISENTGYSLYEAYPSDSVITFGGPSSPRVLIGRAGSRSWSTEGWNRVTNAPVTPYYLIHKHVEGQDLEATRVNAQAWLGEQIQSGAWARKRITAATGSTAPTEGISPMYQAFLNRGDALMESGKLAEARMAFQEAIELNPEDTAGRVRVAKVHLAMNSTEAAFTQISEAIAHGLRDEAVLIEDEALKPLWREQRYQALIESTLGRDGSNALAERLSRIAEQDEAAKVAKLHQRIQGLWRLSFESTPSVMEDFGGFKLTIRGERVMASGGRTTNRPTTTYTYSGEGLLQGRTLSIGVVEKVVTTSKRGKSHDSYVHDLQFEIAADGSTLRTNIARDLVMCR